MGLWKRILGTPHSAEEIADAVVYVVAKDAFAHIRDKDFQRLLDWNKLSDENKKLLHLELQLNGIVFSYLLLEALEEHLEHGTSKQSARSVRNELISAFIRYSPERSDPELRETIVQLIARRCEECREDFKQHRGQLDPEDLERIYWVEFCATNALNHLLADRPSDQRDKTLYENMAVWNMRLATEIQKSILKRAKLTRLA